MSSTTEERSSIPITPEDSPGSSVSTRFQEEYDELLKYAVVIPNYNPQVLPKTLADARESFPRFDIHQRHRPELIKESSESEDTLVTDDQDNLISPSAEVNPVEEIASRSEEDIPRHPVYMTPAMSKQPSRYMTDVLVTPESESTPMTPQSEDDRDRESTPAYSPTVDHDLVKMEHYLDIWSGDLKRNVLAELSQCKIKVLEQGRQKLLREHERHSAEMNMLHNDMEGLKELLHTYEQSINKKDEVISNLTNGLQNQKNKFEMMKKFCDWKIRHNEEKREKFASNLAWRHYRRGLAQKSWIAWHAIVEHKWRQRVEKACQAKAQEVCMSLTNDYEAKLASVNEALDAARTEVSKLHKEREQYEETMKKAFMRGVCALNMEAMNIFQDGDNDARGDEHIENIHASGSWGRGQGQSGGHGDSNQHRVIPQEPVYVSDKLPTSHCPRVVTSQSAMSRSNALGQSGFKSQSGTATTITTSAKVPKVVTVKMSAGVAGDKKRSALGSGEPYLGMGSLAPSMASVVVERHQSIVKQTIGHATAAKFPIKTSQPVGSINTQQKSSNTLPVPPRRVMTQSTKNSSSVHPVKVVT